MSTKNTLLWTALGMVVAVIFYYLSLFLMVEAFWWWVKHVDGWRGPG